MEPSLRTFSKQADRLFERGVAAARGGQRTLAASLLRQAVKLNPHHEHAWLWLSGVLDDAQDQAFCLRAALDINPDNERAKQGLLAVLARMEAAERPPKKFQPAANPLREEAPRDPWWVGWRDGRTAWRLTVRLFWLVPSLLLVITLILRGGVLAQLLPSITYENIAAPATAAPVPSAVTQRARTATAAPPAAVDPATITAYFGVVRGMQARLNAATTNYRATTAAARTTVERAAAARSLREAVVREEQSLAALAVPAPLAAPHRVYGEGLRMEAQALELLLNFYATADATSANRAALGLQDARAKIDEGKRGWNSFAEQFNEQ